MKKILLTSIALASCVSAFGQGQIVYANSDSSSNFVRLSPTYTSTYVASDPKSGSGLVVELFWYNPGTELYQLQDTFTSTFTGNGSGGQLPGQFSAGTITIPQSGTQSFYIEGFYTSGAVAYSGTTLDFTAAVTVSPAPVGHTDTGGNWYTGGTPGDLMLAPVPEPTTIALGGLGAAALLLFRRRK